MSLERLQRNFQNISVSNLLYETFNDAGIKAFIIDLNKEKQLFAKGVGVDGKIVGYYSLATSLINPNKKYNTPYNFKDTGAMFRSFRVKVDKEGIEIEADAEKLVDSNIIEDEAQILGFTNESRKELIKEILPVLASKVREKSLK